MDRRLRIARLLITVPAVFLVVGPPVADLNESHVLNPLWSSHARLHTVWLISTNALVSLTALALMWRPGLAVPRNSVLLAGTLVGAVLVGFFVAGATQSFYGGAFTDSNGVGVTIGPTDANLAAFGVLLAVVAAALVFAREPAA
jgi:hypothetical protein